MRPVTLSSAANTAIVFLIISARAGPAPRPTIRAARTKPKTSEAPGPEALRRCIIPHTFRTGPAIVVPVRSWICKRVVHDWGMDVAAPLRPNVRHRTAA